MVVIHSQFGNAACFNNAITIFLLVAGGTGKARLVIWALHWLRYNTTE